MVPMPAVDLNNGLWYAEEMGWIHPPDEKTRILKPKHMPEEWDFGQGVKDLENAILYWLGKLADRETDPEDYQVGTALMGYPPHDILIAMRELERKKLVHEYAIEDTLSELEEDKPSTYIFYTLMQNKNKQWGSKHFKKNPLGDDDETKTSDVKVG